MLQIRAAKHLLPGKFKQGPQGKAKALWLALPCGCSHLYGGAGIRLGTNTTLRTVIQ